MSITFKDRITFYDADIDGDVEVEISSDDGNVHVYLTQQQIKDTIEFLEKQLYKP